MTNHLQIKEVMSFFPETIKIKKAVFKKMLVVLTQANQNICLQQACEQTGLYTHSKNILDNFKEFSLDEIKEIFFYSSLAILKYSIPKLGLRYIKLAVDITEEPYYGKLDNAYIWSRTPKSPSGATGAYKYLTISATSHNCKLILFNMMLGPGYQIDELIPIFLENIFQKMIVLKI